MTGAVIRDGAIIGSNTMVSKEIDANSLAVGNPAKVRSYRYDEKR